VCEDYGTPVGVSQRSRAGDEMNARRMATFQAVQVLRDTGTAFLCLIGKQQVVVPLTEIRYGSMLAKTGDRGTLIVSNWFARQVRLRRRDLAAT
jgi:hypothetical protein